MRVIFPEVAVSAATITAIVARFALGTREATPFVHSGTSHTIFMLDDAFVLRIPRNHPACISSVAIEAIAVPAARAAGVHTPELIAVDETLDLLPVPYMIYERVHGVALEQISSEPGSTPDVWRGLGQDLARLHEGVCATEPVTKIAAATDDLDPRPWLQEIAAAGMIAFEAIDYFENWLERLAPIALVPPSHWFCHGDVNRGNILIDLNTRAYLALIDWAGVFWGDRAYDFAVVSLSVVPWILEGYRAVTPLEADTTIEARILWQHLRIGLYGMRSAPQRGEVWATQRLDRLLAGIGLFLTAPCAQWLADLGPKMRN
jgi:aminoglycoside phosphotransferase (APT) family kinase protein